MSKLLRYSDKGSIYFITAVTFKRKRILIGDFELLWESIIMMTKKHASDVIAWVVMPDHLHLLIDTHDNEISALLHDVKLSFGARFRKHHKMLSGRIWQKRFWDHVIRDQKDLNHHVDYIHINPVRHGDVNNPFNWKYSSIHEYVERGYYPNDWGIGESFTFNGEFGE